MFSPFEIASAIVTGLAVWLTARQIVWCWPVSLLSVAMYTVVFWNARLYADAGLQIIYGVFAIYGWWAWLHGGSEGGALRVTRLTLAQAIGALITGAAASVSLAYALGRWTDAAAPWADSTLSCYSLVAQWMLTRKKIENWIVWIVLDVGYVALFITRGMVPTAILYGVFLILAAIGLQQWSVSMRKENES